MSIEVSDAELKRALQSIDPYNFEHFIGDLWERKGWETAVSDAANDQGVDVRASKSYPYDQKLLIQAKCYGPGTTVGGPDVQQYASLAHQEDGVDKVLIATTNEFTPQGHAIADNLNVKCLNGDGLVDVIRQEDAMDIVADYADLEARRDDPEPTSADNHDGESRRADQRDCRTGRPCRRPIRQH